ncbi:cytochrome P450 [Saccharopolyspora gloriosae]|uniref:Cytochrome P450 n=1 Tax=Saccharopolyspora gloriosae TaxID=455344 RepID=A0A840NPX2_9PSEU|nr:cytochrome P450 [Saccharopolyspora gloriosae]MBB5072408.1 hypothetical protein [Saccharopolyspora gloriosae]
MIASERWGLPESQFWLRGERPATAVQRDPDTGGAHVYGHAEAVRVLGDPRSYSSNTSRLQPQMQEFVEGDLLQWDPPEHTKLRRLVSRAFTPKVVAGLEPRITEITRELLDRAGDRLDLVADVAHPLPSIVIAELLGVPADERDLFTGWVDVALGGTEPGGSDSDPEQRTRTAVAMFRKLRDYLTEHADERRAHPREDLLTRLVEAEVDDVRLTRAEVAHFATSLLIAGHLTTTMLLGNTVLCLDAHPEHQARARTDRRALPAVIEESLRLLSPFASVARVTTAEVELGGQRIPADRPVSVWLGAANRDPRRFPDPDVFDPARDPNPHLGFGRGVHFCLGAPLARLEGEVVLGQLLDRFPGFGTVPEDPPRFRGHPSLTGVQRLPLRAV